VYLSVLFSGNPHKVAWVIGPASMPRDNVMEMVGFHLAVAVATFTLPILNEAAAAVITPATFTGHWQLANGEPALGVIVATIDAGSLVVFCYPAHLLEALVLGNHVLPQVVKSECRSSKVA
jgi:hypothetical protein